MKTVFVIIGLVVLQLTALSQTETAPQTQVKPAIPAGCPVVYSETDNTIVLKDPAANSCTELVFEMLPPVTQTMVPVRLALKKGTYTFKKHPDLEVQAGYTFVIEDTMTGGTYDFSRERPFTFNVTRTVLDRFVMFVSKTKPSSVATK